MVESCGFGRNGVAREGIDEKNRMVEFDESEIVESMRSKFLGPLRMAVDEESLRVENRGRENRWMADTTPGSESALGCEMRRHDPLG